MPWPVTVTSVKLQRQLPVISQWGEQFIDAHRFHPPSSRVWVFTYDVKFTHVLTPLCLVSPTALSPVIPHLFGAQFLADRPLLLLLLLLAALELRLVLA